MNSLITLFYRFIAYPLLQIYWFIFRPKTFGVKVIIKYKNQILFVKNTYRNSFWTLPGGGVKGGESPQQAALREIKEELDINLKKILNHGNFSYLEEHKKDTVWVLSANIPNPSFKIDTKEIKEAKWIKITDIPTLPPSLVTRNSLRLAQINYST